MGNNEFANEVITRASEIITGAFFVIAMYVVLLLLLTILITMIIYVIKTKKTKREDEEDESTGTEHSKEQ